MIKLFEWGRKICPRFLLGLYDKLFFTEGGLYLVFGGLTTVVSYAAYMIPSAAFGVNSMENEGAKNTAVVAINIFSWICAVLFAYFTNRKYVFNSDKTGSREVAAEFFGFVASRLVTLGLETVAMLLLVSLLGLNDLISKVIASVFVLIGNYVLSKLLVFRKKK